MIVKNAIITGASSGIGLALAEILASQKSNLVLVARRADRLEAIAARLSQQHQIQCYVVASDLAKAGEAKRLREWCEQKQFPVDALINNAGVGVWGPFTDKKLADELAMIDLNIRSLTELCGEFFPLLKQRSSGVLNVASTAAFQAIPTFGAYAASKSYVLSFSRALHREWKEHGITVTALCPGPTKTEFMEHAKLSHVDNLAKMFEASAHSVALAGLKGLERGKMEVVPGFLNWIGSQLARIVPRYLSEFVSGKFFR